MNAGLRREVTDLSKRKADNVKNSGSRKVETK